MQNGNERMTMACPLNGKLCVGGRREDFTKDAVGAPVVCRLWTHVIGMDPQSGQQIDNFDCSLAWMPVLMVEQSNQVRQGTASTDKVANIIYGSMPPEIQHKVKGSLPISATQLPASHTPKQIENGNKPQ